MPSMTASFPAYREKRRETTSSRGIPAFSLIPIWKEIRFSGESGFGSAFRRLGKIY